MYILTAFRFMFTWSFFFLGTFPDLCFVSQVRHLDPPTVFAETLLHAIYEHLLALDLLPVASQIILEVICTALVYDPAYHICRIAVSCLSHLTLFLPEWIRRSFQHLSWVVPPFMVQLVLTLTRCISLGVMRQLWVAYYIMYNFPNPKAIIEKSAILIFVKFFLGAPASLVCVYWVLMIAHRYIFKFQGKSYKDLLLLCVLSLLYVAIVEWVEGFYVLSLTYTFISYMTYFYWLLC